MNTLVTALGWTLIHFLWQGLLLGCATAVALAVLRNARPGVRYSVACAALLACAVWPLVSLLQRLGSAGGGEPAALFSSTLLPATLADDSGVINLHQAMYWIVSLWALCAAVLLLRMACGLLWIERARQQHGRVHPVWQARLEQLARRAGIRRPVHLRVLDTLDSPVTAGCWRPLVLVPAALLSGLPPDLLEALLAHELAHIRHHDYLVNLLQNAIETLLFYHPAVWWISQRIRSEREQMADDFAARQLGEPRRLALALSELERLQFSTHHLALAANGGDLMLRIKRLLRPAPQALNWKAAIPMLGLAVACLALYAEATAADKTAAKRVPAVVDFNSCAQPVYPEASIKAVEEGTVTLGFLIDVDGKVSDAKVQKSSGHPALDAAAQTGIRLCSFKPATLAGKPVKSWLKMQYVWQLK
ncbi:MAG: M56 family metallopeptidase [Sphingomonadaceae bacterium]